MRWTIRILQYSGRFQVRELIDRKIVEAVRVCTGDKRAVDAERPHLLNLIDGESGVSGMCQARNVVGRDAECAQARNVIGRQIFEAGGG